jgi:hypothetical protein
MHCGKAFRALMISSTHTLQQVILTLWQIDLEEEVVTHTRDQKFDAAVVHVR